MERERERERLRWRKREREIRTETSTQSSTTPNISEGKESECSKQGCVMSFKKAKSAEFGLFFEIVCQN